MTIRLDLHVHSQRSADGCMSISEIVAQARKRGLRGLQSATTISRQKPFRSTMIF